MRFWNISVMDMGTKKTIFGPKRCMNIKDANIMFKEKKEEFPAPQYTVYKENY
jgi:hypothetical protein